MGQQIIKWILVGILAGIWIAVYRLSNHHPAHQATFIIFSILGAARYCKCQPAAEEVRHG